MTTQRKTLRNFPDTLPGQSKNLSNLRTKTIKTLRNWENAQKYGAPRNRELALKRAASNALHAYSSAHMKNIDEKFNSLERGRIGTARNMSGYYVPTINYNNNNSNVLPGTKRPRKISSSNLLGGRRGSKRQTRRK